MKETVRFLGWDVHAVTQVAALRSAFLSQRDALHPELGQSCTV